MPSTWSIEIGPGPARMSAAAIVRCQRKLGAALVDPDGFVAVVLRQATIIGAVVTIGPIGETSPSAVSPPPAISVVPATRAYSGAGSRPSPRTLWPVPLYLFHRMRQRAFAHRGPREGNP
jgi:hypothetical protein